MIVSARRSMPQANSNWSMVIVASCSRTSWRRSAACSRVPASTLTTKAPSARRMTARLPMLSGGHERGRWQTHGAERRPNGLACGRSIRMSPQLQWETAGRWRRTRTVLGGRAGGHRLIVGTSEIFQPNRQIGRCGRANRCHPARRTRQRSRRRRVDRVSRRPIPAVRAMEWRRRTVRSGTASSTCRCRSARRSRTRTRPRGGSTRCWPLAPTSSRTSSPRVTRRGGTRADQLVDALGLSGGDRAGDTHQRAVEPAAQPAVLSAPLRRAASTTTVPRVNAAMTRLRLRNRTRVGDRPGASSETTAVVVAEMLEQSAVGCRVGAVDAAGEHRDRAAAGGEGAAVGGLVDAEGRAGDDGVAGPGDRRRSRPRRSCRRSSPSGSRRRRRTRRARRGAAGPRTHSPSGGPPRSLSVSEAMRWSTWVGHSSSPGTTNLMPRRSARSRSRSGSVDSSRDATSVSTRRAGRDGPRDGRGP